jgi:hypothetical protein
MFSAAQNVVINHHDLPRNSPQLHHDLPPQNQRKMSSNTKESSVFSSRYLTMTGAARLNPHSAPLPLETTLDPGTTTAPSGIISGISAVAL